MTLQEYLKLSADDEVLQTKIMALYQPCHSLVHSIQEIANARLHDLITQADVGSLMRLALSNPKVDELCKSLIFDDFWNEAWRQCGLNPTELSDINHKPTHEYLAMETVSSFELVKGYFVYQGYLNLITNQTSTHELILTAEEYLTSSADCGCFFAMNALCTQGLELLPTLEENPQEFKKVADKIFFYASQAANLYWTPGYILLSNVSQELSQYAHLLFADDGLISKKMCFRNALEAIYLAQKLEPFSSSMVNNAYQGKTIVAASNNQFRSWLQSKIRLQNLSNGLIQSSDLKGVERSANLQFNELRKKYLLLDAATMGINAISSNDTTIKKSLSG